MNKEQILTNTDLITEQNDNIIPFKKPAAKLALITGGPTVDENWLSRLANGTVFLSRLKTKTGQQVDPMQKLILNVYLVQEQKTMSTNLRWRRADDSEINFWTPTLEFSRTMELIEVLAVLEFDKDEKDTKDGNSKGTV